MDRPLRRERPEQLQNGRAEAGQVDDDEDDSSERERDGSIDRGGGLERPSVAAAGALPFHAHAV